jgi:deoxyribonuclease V
MQLHSPHDWNLTPEAAIALQQELRDRVSLTDQLGEVQYVAGVDVGFEAAGAVTRAAVAVLNLKDLQLRDRAIARRPTEFPYSPFEKCLLFWTPWNACRLNPI